MASKAFPDDVPEGLKPRLRMFLSVDLVGSTPFKQSRNAWRPEILNFYRDFDYILYRQYRDFAKTLERPLMAPEFWKSNGDELLYTWEFQNLAHAHAIMHIWLDTLAEYRSIDSAVSKHLDVKSTAWVALFPVPNSEIFFRRGTTQLRTAEIDDAVLSQSEMRDDWYTNGNSYEFTKEYVGPSIDTGFRLTSWASASRLIVSVDLAFLLTNLFSADAGPLLLHFSGKEKLKGVIDNQPYPTLWIPVAGGVPPEPSPRRGPIITDPAVIRAQCEAVIEQNYKFITPIFLSFATRDDYEWVPPYIQKQILQNWREENQYKRQRLESRSPEGVTDEAR